MGRSAQNERKRCLTSLLILILLLSASACTAGGGQQLSNSTPTLSAIRLPPQWTETPWPGPTSEAEQDTAQEWAACLDPVYPLSTLKAGNMAVVTSDIVRLVQLRDIAGWVGSREVAVLQPGDQVEILEGPVCLDQFIWWRVRSTTSGAEGWVIEGNQYENWLFPLR